MKATAFTTFFLSRLFVLFAIQLPVIKIIHYNISLTQFLYTLLARYSLFLTLPCTCVTLGLLSADRQTSSVTYTSVTGNISQTCDILISLPSELTFNNVLTVDDLGDTAQFIFTEFAGSQITLDTGSF